MKPVGTVLGTVPLLGVGRDPEPHLRVVRNRGRVRTVVAMDLDPNNNDDRPLTTEPRLPPEDGTSMERTAWWVLHPDALLQQLRRGQVLRWVPAIAEVDPPEQQS